MTGGFQSNDAYIKFLKEQKEKPKSIKSVNQNWTATIKLYNKFYFKVKGHDEIYRAILVDKDLWAVDKMKSYFGRSCILDRIYSKEWELITL